jgi:hemerythrin
MHEEFMKWEPAFNLGIEKIDNQHRKIVELINSLNLAAMDNNSEEKIDDVLSQMTSYSQYHFKTEEDLFKKYSFPLFEEHLAEHASFIRKIAEFRSKFDQGQSIIFRLLSYLRSWLSNHILDSDREYVDIVRSKGF